MKKFLLIAVAALAIMGCTKEPVSNPDLVYTGPTEIEIAEGTNFYNVTFEANKPWFAVMLADTLSTGAKAVSINKEIGEAGSQTIKVTFEDLEKDQAGRPSILTVSTGTEENSFAIVFYQGKVFMLMIKETEMPVTGGSVSQSIITNCKYTVKKYDQFEEWAPCTVDSLKKTVAFAVSENKGYDPRQAYVKFTVDEIQIPILDGEGKPTGETEAATYRFYVNQAGAMQQAWRTEFTTDIALASTHTIAKFGDKVYVANAKKPNDLFVYNSETGASEGTKTVSDICASAINSICTDDAGNLLIAFGGAYGTGVANFEVYRINAGSTISAANATRLINYANGFYGFGLDNIKVTGDATASAAISAVSGGVGPDGSYVASWQVTNGTCAESESYTACAILPTEVNPEWGAIWYSGDIVARHTTETVSSGILYMGYDAHYNLCYNPSMTGEWTKFWTAGVSGWGENLSGLDVITWGTKKCIVYIANTFFTEWGMGSYVSVLDATDMTKVSQLSRSEHYYKEGTPKFGSTDSPNERTGDVCAVVENGNLVVYVVDGGNAYLTKLVYPAAK